MNGNDRREKLLSILQESQTAVSGKTLAGRLEVSRQVIVQDIALLRANGNDIISTNLGYVLMSNKECRRVFKMQHSDDQVIEELSLIVDYGGRICDVFVFHRVYGTVRAEMDIKNKLDIDRFMDDIATGKSSLLMNITSGYHYHTVAAADEETLDIIQKKLEERNFLAPLQDYEPIDFWKDKKESANEQ